MKLMIDPDLPDHPKVWKLAKLLKVDEDKALGLILKLFAWGLKDALTRIETLDQLPSVGVLRGSSAPLLPRMIRSKISATKLVAALVNSGLLEREGKDYRIHQLLEWQGGIIAKRIKDRINKRHELATNSPRSRSDFVARSRPPIPSPPIPSLPAAAQQGGVSLEGVRGMAPDQAMEVMIDRYMANIWSGSPRKVVEEQFWSAAKFRELTREKLYEATGPESQHRGLDPFKFVSALTGDNGKHEPQDRRRTNRSSSYPSNYYVHKDGMVEDVYQKDASGAYVMTNDEHVVRPEFTKDKFGKWIKNGVPSC